LLILKKFFGNGQKKLPVSFKKAHDNAIFSESRILLKTFAKSVDKTEKMRYNKQRRQELIERLSLKDVGV